jgi:hypothetical protein
LLSLRGPNVLFCPFEKDIVTVLRKISNGA